MSPGPEEHGAADSLEEGPRGTLLGGQAGECWHRLREAGRPCWQLLKEGAVRGPPQEPPSLISATIAADYVR